MSLWTIAAKIITSMNIFSVLNAAFIFTDVTMEPKRGLPGIIMLNAARSATGQRALSPPGLWREKTRQYR